QPPSVATHHFTGAGEVIAAGYFGTSGVNGEVAWSPLAHMALHGGAAWITALSPTNDSPSLVPPYYGEQIVERNVLMEGAVGWYTDIDSLASLAIYAGYGGGQSAVYQYANRFRADTAFERVEGDYYRYTIQINISRLVFDNSPDPASRRWRSGAAGLIVKVSYITYDRFAGNLRRLNPPGGVFLEPILFMQGGTPAIQFEIQGGFATPLHRWSGLSVYPLQISIGIHSQLDRIF
ncbi:MAG: hypothetical protein ABI876_05630, partial [Bacteroidota bacterium]